MIRNVSLDLIDPNPFQTRPLDPEFVAGLAEEIREHGFKDVLFGRPCPADPNRVQLRDGHQRVAALLIVAQTDAAYRTVAMDVSEMTDAEMDDFVIIENAWRKNLNIIEIGEAMTRYKARHPETTQEQLGKLFNYKQPTVSNALRLQQLPPEIKAHVAAGDLSENVARRLIPVARVAPEKAVELANEVVDEEPEDRESAVLEGFDQVLANKGKKLNQVPWQLDWPAKPISAEMARSDKGEPATVPSCTACEFYVEANWTKWCTRPACFGLKARLFSAMEAKRVSKALGIPLARENETVEIILTTSSVYGRQDGAQAALKTKHASLRIVPTNGVKTSWECRQVLDSDVAGLATTDMEGLKKALSKKSAREIDKPDKPTATSQDDPERKARELAKHAKEERATERVEAECIRLRRAAALHLAAALPRNYLLDLIAMQCEQGSGWELGYAQRKEYAKLPVAEKQVLVMQAMLYDAVEYDQHKPRPDDVRSDLIGLAATLKVKLPRDWDDLEKFPHPMDAIHCWHCGLEGAHSYGGKDELMSSEIAKGWRVQKDGKELVGVLCPECAELAAAEDEKMRDLGAPAKAKKPAKKKAKK